MYLNSSFCVVLPGPGWHQMTDLLVWAGPSDLPCLVPGSATNQEISSLEPPDGSVVCEHNKAWTFVLVTCMKTDLVMFVCWTLTLLEFSMLGVTHSCLVSDEEDMHEFIIIPSLSSFRNIMWTMTNHQHTASCWDRAFWSYICVCFKCDGTYFIKTPKILNLIECGCATLKSFLGLFNLSASYLQWWNIWVISFHRRVSCFRWCKMLSRVLCL